MHKTIIALISFYRGEGVDMKRVVIGFDAKGEPYIVSKPKKVEVVFKQPRKRTVKKRIKAIFYRLKTWA